MSAYGTHVRNRRRTLGLSVRALGGRAGVTGGQIGHVEQGRHAPSAELRTRLDRIIALGAQRHDDEQVVYALAVPALDEPPRWLWDAERRAALFFERDTADASCAWLAQVGLPGVC